MDSFKQAGFDDGTSEIRRPRIVVIRSIKRRNIRNIKVIFGRYFKRRTCECSQADLASKMARVVDRLAAQRANEVLP